MNIMASGALPHDDRDEERAESRDRDEAATTTPGGKREIRWEVVTKTAGLATAEIIAQRLVAEGIPARAWQEGAGQAIGLTIGLLGTGHVVVPEVYVEQAKAILASPVNDLEDEETFNAGGSLEEDE